MILQLAALSQIEATEAVIGGERFLIVRADSLEGLYRPAVAETAAGNPRRTPAEDAAPNPPRSERRRVAKVVKTRRKQAPVEASALERDYVPVKDMVKARLEKKPLTSGELIKAIGGSAGSIYQALSALRQAGEVETRIDDESGERKNFLVEVAA